MSVWIRISFCLFFRVRYTLVKKRALFFCLLASRAVIFRRDRTTKKENLCTCVVVFFVLFHEAAVVTFRPYFFWGVDMLSAQGCVCIFESQPEKKHPDTTTVSFTKQHETHTSQQTFQKKKINVSSGIYPAKREEKPFLARWNLPGVPRDSVCLEQFQLSASYASDNGPRFLFFFFFSRTRRRPSPPK